MKGEYNNKRDTLKHSRFPDLDKAVSKWFKKVQSTNVPVNGPLLEGESRYYTEKHGHEIFKASSEFLARLKEREGITSQVISGEEISYSVDPNEVGTWSERLQDICRGYDPKDRFNVDKTGLLWKAKPTQTLNFKGQKCSVGSMVKSLSLS